MVVVAAAAALPVAGVAVAVVPTQLTFTAALTQR